MDNAYKTAIIGGGFSGMVLACELAEKYGERVALIEKNDRLGKKLLATGNGRGNLTNSDTSVSHYHSVCGADISFVLERFGRQSIEDWFYSLGVPLSYEGNKAYPASRQASAVSDALRAKISYFGADVFLSFKCVEVLRNGDCFTVVSADGKKIKAEKVVLALGGKAGKQYGTDGDCYAIAEKLGHKVTAVYPSLVQLKTERAKIKGLKGIKVEADVSVTVGDKEIVNTRGDVLFTEYGVSGNAVFYVSAYVADKKNAELKLAFLPEYGEDELREIIESKITSLPYLASEDVLSGIINKQLGKAVLRNLGINVLRAGDGKRISAEIKGMKLKVEGSLGFDYAQVTHGGVACADVNSRTFESKKVKGLYFTGEALDVDGDCGGYNLQFAYASARCVAAAITENDNK